MRFTRFLILLLVLSLLAGCGPARQAPEPGQTGGGSTGPSTGASPVASAVPPAPVRLTLWHPYSGVLGKQFEALVGSFNSTHPGIVVEPSYGGSMWTMRDKLLVAISGHAAPDVSIIDQFWSSELADAGALLPAEQFLAADSGFDRQDISSLAWETSIYNGKIWSMPFAMSQLVLYYNKELFGRAGLDPARPPATWDELARDAAALTRDLNGDKVPEQWGVSFPLRAQDGVVYDWIAFLWQAGGELFTPDVTGARFQEPAGVEALAYLQRLVNEGSLPLSPPEQGFDKGQIAMTVASSAALASEITALGDRLGVAPLPCGRTCATGVGGANLAIFAGSAHPKEAWDFVRWMSSAEVSLRWSMQTGYSPFRRSVADSEEYEGYLRGEPRAKVALDQMSVARARPNVPVYAGASRELGLAVEQALFSGTDPAGALQAAAERCQPLFAGQAK
jgi:ABC-type glycerol-3-phosphate transport system substrate-binding protein